MADSRSASRSESESRPPTKPGTDDLLETGEVGLPVLQGFDGFPHSDEELGERLWHAFAGPADDQFETSQVNDPYLMTVTGPPYAPRNTCPRSVSDQTSTPHAPLSPGGVSPIGTGWIRSTPSSTRRGFPESCRPTTSPGRGASPRTRGFVTRPSFCRSYDLASRTQERATIA